MGALYPLLRHSKPVTEKAGPSLSQETTARLILGQLVEFGSEQAFQQLAYPAVSDGLKRSWARLVTASQDVRIALRLGELFGPMSNTVNSWAWCTGNPRVALSVISDYWSVVSPVTSCQVLESEGLVGIRYSSLHSVPPSAEDIQFRFSSWLTMLRSMVGSSLDPVRTSFQFRKPTYEAEFERVFRCPIEWNRPVSELWFASNELVARPDWTPRLELPSADFWDQRTTLPAGGDGDNRSLIDKLEDIVDHSLRQGEFGIKRVAPRLGMSERTVIRRLREESTTFRDVVERVRRTRAAQLLRAPKFSLTQIATELGYSNPQNFARAFRRWFGMSPQQARRRLQAGALPTQLQ